MLDSENFTLKKALANAYRALENHDPYLAVFYVRDFQQLIDWDLSDLAWAMDKSSSLSKSDITYLLDQIDKRLAVEETRDA